MVGNTWHEAATELEPRDYQARAEVLPFLRRMAIQRDLDGAELVLARTARDLVGASRICVHYLDEGNNCLWTVEAPERGICADGPGAVAIAARTGEPIRVDRLEPALLVPLIRSGAVIGVLTAVREPARGPFGRSDEAVLIALANGAAPILGAHINPGR